MTSLSRQRISDLVQVGLPEAEAEVYYHLAMVRQAKAAELAQATGRRRPDMYPLLERLVQRGLVQRTTDRPTLYVALDIADAMRRLVAMRRLEQQGMEIQADALVQAWPPVRDEVGPPLETMAVHQGLSQILTILEERLGNARHHVSVLLSPSMLHRIGALREVLGHMAGDRQVRILTSIDTPSDLDALGAARRMDVRHLSLPSHLEMVLIDSQEAFVFLSAGRADSTLGKEEQVLWLRSADIALALQAVHDLLWGAGRPCEHRLKQLQGDTGTGSRLMHGHWVRDQVIKDMIHGAIRDVRVVVDAATARQWHESGVWAALQGRAGQLRLDVIAPMEIQGLEIRRPVAPGPGASFVVADRREAVCSWRADAGEEPESLWTDAPDVLQLLLDGQQPIQPQAKRTA